jgi:hypothetical protein
MDGEHQGLLATEPSIHRDVLLRHRVPLFVNA